MIAAFLLRLPFLKQQLSIRKTFFFCHLFKQTILRHAPNCKIVLPMQAKLPPSPRCNHLPSSREFDASLLGAFRQTNKNLARHVLSCWGVSASLCLVYSLHDVLNQLFLSEISIRRLGSWSLERLCSTLR